MLKNTLLYNFPGKQIVILKTKPVISNKVLGTVVVEPPK